LRLCLRLLWQWTHSDAGVITSTGLAISDNLVRFLVRKERDKMFMGSDDHTRRMAERASDHILQLVLADELPMEPML
jgi:hypothetical protein